MKKILLVDGHNLLFRMFYGIPAPIKNSKGKDIRGLIGFIGSLKKFTSTFEPYSIYVVFDSETSTQTNSSIDNTYKTNRINYNEVKEEDNPFSQLSKIKSALNFLEIGHLEVQDNEADDYIASIVTNNSKDNYQFIIISTDKDFLQLVNAYTFLYVPRGKQSHFFNEEEITNTYKIPSSKYILYKSLVGDASDNIKGIKGIGKVTASKILEYPSIEDYVSKNLNSKISKLLTDNKKIIIKNYKLISMNKKINTNIEFNKLSDKILKFKTYEIIEQIDER